MKSENNGKIAIAIVAMFVVALSIVGFTYAYFTANVEGNTSEKSVEVVAGILQVDYTQNRKLEAQNIVPGWKSDELHYYDTLASVYDVKDAEGETVLVDGIPVKGIKAVEAASASEVPEGVDSSDGLVGPATFTVENTGTAAANYVIKLTNIQNGIAAADQENLTYTLYRTSAIDENGAPTITASDEVVGSTTALPATGGTAYITAAANTPEVLTANGDAKYYYLMLEYANVENYDKDNAESQNASKNATVSVTVEVVGVQKNNAGTAWVDADGNTIFTISN